MFSKPIRNIILICLIIILGVIFFAIKTHIKSDNIPNNSLEQFASQTNSPVAWHTGNWGTNKAIFTYLSSGHNGTHSVKTEITNYKNGDAKWYYAAQPAVPGKQYTFTDYYKANVRSRVVVDKKLVF